MKKILVLHGPNLNLLGQREPSIYGKTSLTQLNERLIQRAQEHGYNLSAMQSNHEGDLIEAIHQALTNGVNYIIINPAAYTHTSIGLRDALLSVKIPFIEVHISNIFAREPYRAHSYLSDVALGSIIGMGIYGYLLALDAVIEAERVIHADSKN